MEAAENAPRARKLQVFATDLNDALLDKARHGLYAKSLAQDVSPERLRRFFVEEEGGYRVVKPLREMVVFARQNLISDPPFSRMDLISCRNLLIYLEPSLQKKAHAHLPLRAQAARDSCFWARRNPSAASPTCLSRWTKSTRSIPKKLRPLRRFICRSKKTVASSRHRPSDAALPIGKGQAGAAGRSPRRTQRPARGRPRHGQSIRSARRAHQCRVANPAIPRADRRVS